MKHYINVLLLSTFFSSFIYAQETHYSKDKLSFIDLDRQIENCLDLFLSEKEFNKLKKETGNKVSFKERNIVFNFDTVIARKIHTRGQTTLKFRRKSFSLSFDRKVIIYKNNESKEFQNIYALNLVLDKNYVNNRLAFALLGKIGFPDLYYSYGEVRINNQSEGIYLFIERPQDWAFNEGTPFIIRRGDQHDLTKVITKKKLNPVETQLFTNKCENLYAYLDQYTGEELYKVLSEILNLEMYMKWLAFNFLVKNGDYTDEVYFYIDPGSNRYNIIPWDFDDIFSSVPHEGYDHIDPVIIDKYIFSSEDPLDVKIVEDEYLYSIYLDQFHNILTTLYPEKIKEELEIIFSELYPYYSNEEIMNMSKYDWFDEVNFTTLKKELNSIYSDLLNTRHEILMKLAVREQKNYNN